MKRCAAEKFIEKISASTCTQLYTGMTNAAAGTSAAPKIIEESPTSMTMIISGTA